MKRNLVICLGIGLVVAGCTDLSERFNRGTPIWLRVAKTSKCEITITGNDDFTTIKSFRAKIIFPECEGK